MDGEKCTAYFFRLEKRKQKKTEIEELITEEGVLVRHTEDVLCQVCSYYKGLFSSQSTDCTAENRVLSALTRKLSSEDSKWCDFGFTDADFENAIGGLNDNKSPGRDGLTTFKCQLIPILSTVFNNMEKMETLP